MRISTANRLNDGVENLMQRKVEVDEAYKVVLSGKKVSKGSDDPTMASVSERARVVIARREADQRALAASKARLEMGEGVLSSSNDVIQRSRELLISAGNSNLNATARGAVSQELQALRGQMLNLSNARTATGEYLFAGQGSTGAPFTEDSKGQPVIFKGTPGAMIGQVGEENVPLTFDGAAIFPTTGDGDIFKALQDAIDTLDDPAASGPAYTQRIMKSVSDLDKGHVNVLKWRSQMGADLNRLEDSSSRVGDEVFQAKIDKSNAEDANMIEAVSTFQLKQTGYDAGLKAYNTVQQLTLFDYVK